MGVSIDKKIIRKKIQGFTVPNQEEVEIQLETTWVKNDLESARLLLIQDHSIEIAPSDMNTLFKTLDYIFSEAQTIKNDNLIVEWILTIENNGSLHVAAEKSNEDDDIAFQLWRDAPSTTKISLSEEEFKNLIDFLASIIPSHEEPTKEKITPETTPTVPVGQDKSQNRGITRLQDRIAELKAQFYRDIEMIAKELEQDTSKTKKENANQHLQSERVTTTSSLETEKISAPRDDVAGDSREIIAKETNTTTTEEPATQLPEEWIDSLKSLLNAESNDKFTHEAPQNRTGDALPDETVNYPSPDDSTKTINKNASEKPTGQDAQDTDDSSSFLVPKNEKEHSLHLPPRPHIAENNNVLVTESLLEKELEEFFGRLKKQKTENQENDQQF